MGRNRKRKWVNDILNQFEDGYDEYLYNFYQENKPWKMNGKGRPKLSIYLLTAVAFDEKLGLGLEFYNFIISLEELEQPIKTPIKVKDESKISFKEYKEGVKWYLSEFKKNKLK